MKKGGMALVQSSMIIIGAGLAGLSAGCYGQMNGFQTHIFEHHTVPGGLCTAWKRKGYTMDGCIHWLMSCKPGSSFREMYDELGAFQHNRLMEISEYGRCLDEETGQSLLFTADMEKLRSDMKTMSPADSQVIDQFVDASLRLRGFDTGIPDPVELMNAWGGMQMFWRMRGMLKSLIHFNMPVEDYARRFRDPFLRMCITNLFLPDMPAYFLFLIMGQLAGGQLGRIEGGSQKFSDAIADRYQGLGGVINYKASVEEILVRNHRAIGIRLSDGTVHYADVIVSAADGYSTIYRILQGRYISKDIESRYLTWPLFQPLVMVTLGVSRTFPDEVSSHNIHFKDPINLPGHAAQDCNLRIFNYDATLAPAGKTVMQVMIESDYDHWMRLVSDEDQYQEAKNKAAGQVMERLEGLYPGLTQQVEVVDVATPYTFWKYTRNHRGSYEGWLMTPTAIQTMLPKTLPGLEDFYMAGQWVEPGGGIPPVLYSGRNLVRILCKKRGQPFRTTQP